MTTYLTRLIDQTRDVLGDDLVGVYAAGSIALGAYQPGRSDIDVSLVVRSGLQTSTKRALVERLRHEHLPCPARGLELVVYTRAVAAAGRAEPAFELELNTGPQLSPRVTMRPEDRPGEDGLFWYALDRSILHSAGLSLWGPPAAEIFADLPAEKVHALLLDSLRWWLAHTPSSEDPAPGADDAVLGACRALARHRLGVWLDKVAAGRWLLTEAGPATGTVRSALRARAGGAPLTGRQARDFQQRAISTLTAAVL